MDVDDTLVLYVYKCAECGHSGEAHLTGDCHEGADFKCRVCGAAAVLEWDGGLSFDRLPGNTH